MKQIKQKFTVSVATFMHAPVDACKCINFLKKYVSSLIAKSSGLATNCVTVFYYCQSVTQMKNLRF